MNSVVELPANLPAIAESGFPVSYEAAKQAIAECESPFECRTKAQQAAALAVYARMRDDTDLLNRAVRLQAWAARRWGELDTEMHPDRRQENLKQNQTPHRKDHARPIGGRAPDGTTEYQRKISHRLAAIPEAEFTRQVESDSPPSVRQLASQGTVKRTVVLDDPAAECFKAACAALHQFATFCDTHDPTETAQTFGADDIEMARRCVSTLDEWLNRFVTSLPAASDL
jgi:hypothetical protein